MICKKSCENLYRFKAKYKLDLYPISEKVDKQDVYDENGDPISGATYSYGGASWWLHKVKDEAEQCIRVYNTNTTTTKVFGFDRFGHLTVKEIEQWLNGNRGLVQTFFDQSGNDYHLIQNDPTRMPAITDEFGIVYLRNCRPCMIFTGDQFLEYFDVLGIFPLNPVESNMTTFGVAEINSNGSFYSKESYQSNGYNNWSLGATTSVRGFMDVSTFEWELTAPDTSTGDCDIWNQIIFTTEGPDSPQFPTGVRQNMELWKNNQFYGLSQSISKLIRPVNPIISGVVPFRMGGSWLSGGTTGNFIGFTSSTPSPNRPIEFLGHSGVQGLSIYMENKKDELLEINKIINDYYEWI